MVNQILFLSVPTLYTISKTNKSGVSLILGYKENDIDNIKNIDIMFKLAETYSNNSKIKFGMSIYFNFINLLKINTISRKILFPNIFNHIISTNQLPNPPADIEIDLNNYKIIISYIDKINISHMFNLILINNKHNKSTNIEFSFYEIYTLFKTLINIETNYPNIISTMLINNVVEITNSPQNMTNNIENNELSEEEIIRKSFELKEKMKNKNILDQLK